MSNIKQIMLGVIQYTQDYDERFPTLVSTDFPSEYPWFHRLQPYIKSTQIFQCPSDSNTAIRISSGIPSAQRYPVSYAANVYTSSGGPAALNVAGIALAEIQQPSTTVYISDAGARTNGVDGIALNSNGEPAEIKNGCALMAYPAYGAAAGSTDYNWCGPNPRHLGMSNVGFMDGHVKSMKVEKWYYTRSGQTPWLNPALGGS